MFEDVASGCPGKQCGRRSLERIRNGVGIKERNFFEQFRVPAGQCRLARTVCSGNKGQSKNEQLGEWLGFSRSEFPRFRSGYRQRTHGSNMGKKGRAAPGILCIGVNTQMLKRYVEIGVDVAVAWGAYYLFGWIGFGLWALFVISWFATQLISDQQVTMKTLLSRLPDRCTVCHREIVDEGGIFDKEGIYHEACLEKLESPEELRKEAGVPSSEAIHKQRASSNA